MTEMIRFARFPPPKIYILTEYMSGKNWNGQIAAKVASQEVMLTREYFFDEHPLVYTESNQ